MRLIKNILRGLINIPSYEIYKKRLYLHGNTKRERTLYNTKRDFENLSKDSLSCKEVVINNTNRNLVIDDGTKPYYKNIKSMPYETFQLGQYVKFAASTYLIINADWDNEIYTDGIMQQCNICLKWQDKNFNIIKKYACIMSASQYNSGENVINKQITIGNNQLIAFLPLDNDTLKLPTDKRMFIDNNIENPKPYKLTRIDTVTMSYENVGCVILLFSEDQFNPQTDRADLMLCDYKEKVEDIKPVEITCNGNPEIRCGGQAKTFTAQTDKDVEWKLKTTEMQQGFVNITSNGNKAKVKCADNKNLIGTSFKLVCICGGIESELLVNIVGGV